MFHRKGTNSNEVERSFPAGLDILYEPRDGDTLADIVFVHGLNGNRETTWTHRESGTFWPKDLLPLKTPRARILTFGYDARVIDLKSVVSKNRLNNHAKTLLMDLAGYRLLDGTDGRDIIFVAHSLGGLVCKDMLLSSSLSAEDHEKRILRCTKGIMFMGTPHRGSSLADWASGLAVAVGYIKQTNLDLLTTLKAGSEVLQKVNSDFHTLIRARAENGEKAFSIICFFEELPLHVIKRPVVPKESSVLDGYLHTGIPANHMDMARFRESDIGFQRVTDYLRIWLVEIEQSREGLTKKAIETSSTYPELDISRKNPSTTRKLNDIEKHCLQSLAFQEIDQRGHDIKSPSQGTCEWIRDDPRYKEWDSRSSGILWILGKPGAGKSTLMKYMLEQIFQSSGYQRDTSLLKLCFFFHGRGAELQRSTLGMVRSLNHQIFSHFPDEFQYLVDRFEKRCDTIGDPGTKWQWSTVELEEVLKSVLARISLYVRPLIFIDAVDECGEIAALSLVRFFENLILHSGETSRLKICFTCRHYPVVSRDYTLRINMEDENTEDIKRYLQEELAREREPKDIRLAGSIAIRAAGSFQWATLVGQRVLRLLYRGKNADEIDKEIDQVPPDLNALYKELIISVDQEDRSVAINLFQWICFSFRPLTLTEIRFALALEVGASSSYSKIQERADRVADDQDSFKRKLMSIACGLIEFQNGTTVQFIHQSVRDFLIRDGLRILSHGYPTASSVSPPVVDGSIDVWIAQAITSIEHTPDNYTGRSNHHLAISCFLYLTADELITEVKNRRLNATHSRDPDGSADSLTSKFPFVSYCAQYWTSHVMAVEAQGIPQGGLIHAMRWPSLHILKHCCYVCEKICGMGVFNDETGFLHIAATLNSESILSELLKDLPPGHITLNAGDQHGYTPLARAAESGNENATRLLLSRDDIDVNAADLLQETALWNAVQGRHEAITKQLLGRRDTDVNATNYAGQSALFGAMNAMISSSSELMRLLITNKDVDVNLRDYEGRTVLSWAAAHGSSSVVSALLERSDTNPDLSDVSGRSPLSHAAAAGSFSVCKILIDIATVFPDRQDSSGRTPLSRAAEQGYRQICQLFLERPDVVADCADVLGRTPLSYAAEHGCIDVCQLLSQRHDVEVDRKDDSGRTPLSYSTTCESAEDCRPLHARTDLQAANELNTYQDHVAVTILLLSRGDVNPDSKDITDRTPLSYAASQDCTTVLRLLLDHQADLMSLDCRGITPLSHSIKSKAEYAANLLLMEPAIDVNLRDISGRTPLMEAILSNLGSVIEGILDRDDTILDVVDDLGFSALTLADMGGNEIVAEAIAIKWELQLLDGN